VAGDALLDPGGRLPEKAKQYINKKVTEEKERSLIKIEMLIFF
jgi:hypothetical protein